MLNTAYIQNEAYRSSPSIFIQKAEGCYLIDSEDRTYIDLMLGCGTHILGHSHPEIVSAIQRQAESCLLPIAPTYLPIEYSQLLHDINPSLSGFTFCNSGTEATLRAMRLARAHTGKNKIAVFSGGWHGGQDYALQEEDYEKSTSTQPAPYFKSSGVPEDISDLMLFLPYNDPQALTLIEKHSNDIAMVFIEPVQGSNPRLDIGPFLEALREICHQHQILLGFDEMITGFRLGIQGGIGQFNIEPDIVTYGKIAGGGLPIGILGYQEQLKPTLLGSKSSKPVFMGGTFSANPMSVIAGLTQVKYLQDHQNTLYPSLEKKSAYFESKINQFCHENRIGVHITRAGSMCRILFCQETVNSRKSRDHYEIPRDIQIQFYEKLIKRGLMVNFNGILFICDAHKESDLDKMISIINSELINFEHGGLFNVYREKNHA